MVEVSDWTFQVAGVTRLLASPAGFLEHTSTPISHHLQVRERRHPRSNPPCSCSVLRSSTHQPMTNYYRCSTLCMRAYDPEHTHLVTNLPTWHQHGHMILLPRYSTLQLYNTSTSKALTPATAYRGLQVPSFVGPSLVLLCDPVYI